MTEGCAIFTMIQDDHHWLSIWLKHYLRHFDPQDIYVIDHNSECPVIVDHPVNVIRLPYATSWHHDWMCETVQTFQRFLLNTYRTVVFAEADELVFPSPNWNTNMTLPHALDCFEFDVLQATGFDVVALDGCEPADWSRPLLSQGRTLFPSALYCKPTITRVPVEWSHGFHRLSSGHEVHESEQIVLFHFHYFDRQTLIERNEQRLRRNWDPEAVARGLGGQNRLDAGQVKQEYRKWNKRGGRLAIPENWQKIV